MSALLRMVMCMPLLAVAGCAMLKEPPGITYAKSVEQLGITPVYPPREDLQVGDLYAVEESAAVQHGTGDARAMTAYLDSVDLTGDIQKYLAGRYQFDDTNLTDNTILSASNKILPQTPQTDSDAGTLPAKSTLSVLPITSFPEIEVDSGITVGVSGQPQGLGAALGFEAAKTLKMALQFNRVTSYSVPITDGMVQIKHYCERKPDYCQSKNLALVLNQKYQLGDGKDSISEGSLLLVTKVYLARQITFTFNDATLAAAAMASKASEGTAPAISQTAMNDATTKGDATMIEALAALQTSLNDSLRASTEGSAAVQLAVVNKNSVSFNEVFERPVVIGYEAVSMQGIGGR